MTFRNGFTYGAVIGGFVTFIGLSSIGIDNINISIPNLTNVLITILGFAALVITPIIIYRPTEIDTTTKGFFVGFPWAVAIIPLGIGIYVYVTT